MGCHGLGKGFPSGVALIPGVTAENLDIYSRTLVSSIIVRETNVAKSQLAPACIVYTILYSCTVGLSLAVNN